MKNTKLADIIVNVIDDYLKGSLGTYVKARCTKKAENDLAAKAATYTKKPTKATRKHSPHRTRPMTERRWRGAATVKFMAERWPDIDPGTEQFTRGQLKGTGPSPQANLLARQVYAAGIEAERKTGVFDPLAEYRANKRVRGRINRQVRKARDERWDASKSC